MERARGLLRARRGAARHGAEPPPPAPHPRGDGAARRLRRGLDPQREGEGAARRPPDRRRRGWRRRWCAGSTRPGAVRGRGRCPATARSRGCAPASATETFVALRLWIDNWRWAGVPFYLRTGKRLPAKATEIVVQFRPAPHPILDTVEGDLPAPNLLVLRIQPEEGISLCFEAKVPGLRGPLRPVSMDFRYHDGLRALARPRPTSDSCSTPCWATPRSSRAATRWRPPGRSWTRCWGAARVQRRCRGAVPRRELGPARGGRAPGREPPLARR